MSSNVVVKDIMTKNVPASPQRDNNARSCRYDGQDDLSYMMVEMQGKPTGIITEHDILVRLVSQGNSTKISHSPYGIY